MVHRISMISQEISLNNINKKSKEWKVNEFLINLYKIFFKNYYYK